MNQWKPTREGDYRIGSDVREVWEGKPNYPMVKNPRNQLWEPVPDGPWSLMGPDWQAGAPTVAQLRNWPWWAIESNITWGQLEHKGPILRCCEWAPDVFDPGEAIQSRGEGRLLRAYLTRSAPIQEDMSNGPLWVPRDVAE